MTRVKSFESKVSYKFDIEPFGQIEMARKLSFKYDIENEQKSLSQAKCPISLAPLYDFEAHKNLSQAICNRK